MNERYMDTLPWQLLTDMEVSQFSAIGIYQPDTWKLSCVLGQCGLPLQSSDKGTPLK